MDLLRGASNTEGLLGVLPILADDACHVLQPRLASESERESESESEGKSESESEGESEGESGSE